MVSEKSMNIKWDDSYLIGIEEIDHQHKYFFLLISRLDRMNRGKDKDQFITGTVDELVKYAIFHFKSEENLMEFNGYPQLNDHKLLHINLIEELNNEKLRYENGIIPLDNIVKFIFKWLVIHTTHEDLKFGDFLRRSNK